MRDQRLRFKRAGFYLTVIAALAVGCPEAARSAVPSSQCASAVSVPGAPSEVETADLNGDLKPDLIVATPGNGSVQVLLGTGDGGVSAPLLVATNGAPAGMAIADFDEDGRFDLAVTYPSRSELTVQRGRGDGTFDLPVSYYAPGGPLSVTCNDFTGDGILDLAVLSQTQSRVYLFRGFGTSGVGDGTFATAIYFTVGVSTHRPTRIRSADLDQDGAIDLVFAVPNVQRAGIMYGLKTNGTPNGQFDNLILCFLSNGLTDVIVGDVDRNDLPDVTGACPGRSQIGILNVRPNRTYPDVDVRIMTRPVRHLAEGDYDGDGVRDLAGISDDAVVVMTAAGVETIVQLEPGIQAIQPVDLDGNAVADLVVTAPGSNSIRLLLAGDCLPHLDPIDIVPAGRWAANGVPLFGANGTPSKVTTTPDGQGGVYAAWLDNRESTTPTLRVGHLGADGATATGWPVDGLLVPGQGSPIRAHAVVNDAAGGVFVLVSDVRAGIPTVSLLHQDAGGASAPGWPSEGIRLSNGPASTTMRSLVADGSGGVLAIFETRDSLQALRISPSGAPAPGWPARGINIEDFFAGRTQTRGIWEACGDAAGGIYVSWRTTLPPCHFHGCPPDPSYRTLLSFTNANGSTLVRNEARVRVDPPVRADGLGGALVLRYPESNYGDPLGIVLDRSWSAGTATWSIDASWLSYAVRGFSGDGLGGALFTASPAGDLRVHRRTAMGLTPAGWSQPVMQILPPMEHTSLPDIVGDRRGGGFVTWSTQAGRPSRDVFLAYFTDRGQVAPGWTSGGDPVCTASGAQEAQSMCEDGEGGVIVVWLDGRTGGSHLYAQRFGRDVPVPTTVQFLDYEVVEGLLRLRWSGLDETGNGFSVERGGDDGGWALAGHPVVSGRIIEFTDSEPSPGETRWYRLRWRDASGPRVTPPTMVVGSAPQPTRLTLRATRLPAGPDDELLFTLGAASSGRLEIFDSRGRRQATAELSAPQGAPGRVRLGELTRVVTGIYFARISTASGSTIRKFVYID